jgi:hypothetical protein
MVAMTRLEILAYLAVGFAATFIALEAKISDNILEQPASSWISKDV